MPSRAVFKVQFPQPRIIHELSIHREFIRLTESDTMIYNEHNLSTSGLVAMEVWSFKIQNGDHASYVYVACSRRDRNSAASEMFQSFLPRLLG